MFVTSVAMRSALRAGRLKASRDAPQAMSECTRTCRRRGHRSAGGSPVICRRLKHRSAEGRPDAISGVRVHSIPDTSAGGDREPAPGRGLPPADVLMSAGRPGPAVFTSHQPGASVLSCWRYSPVPAGAGSCRRPFLSYS